MMTHGYVYTPTSLEEQISRLRAIWPSLNPGRWLTEVEKMTLPAEAEGPFAFVRWRRLAPCFGEATEVVLAALGTMRRVVNGRAGMLSGWLRQDERTGVALDRLRQSGDILVAPLQLGKRYAGCSGVTVRERMLATEFGADSVMIGCALITTPSRLQRYEDLFVDCPGDTYRPPEVQADEPNRAFIYEFRDFAIGYHSCPITRAHPHCGAATGFLW